MATHLDLEEQEQLDQFKHFWSRWGNLITGLLTVVLAVYAGWNGWNYWQQHQATQAAKLYDTFEKSVRGKDHQLMARALSDLQSQFPKTTAAQQASLLAARVYTDKKELAEVEKSFVWVIEHSADDGYVALARLRMSAIDLERKNPAKAQSWLAGQKAPAGFLALYEDRLGDIAMLQDKKEDAKTHFLAAWKSMEEKNEYRRLIEIKLAALGVNPQPTANP